MIDVMRSDDLVLSAGVALYIAWTLDHSPALVS
eukprot:COSAG05_NODE_19029_length_299_cov_0.550000_1_plen_32_part_10